MGLFGKPVSHAEIARKIFDVQPMPQGALPVFDLQPLPLCEAMALPMTTSPPIVSGSFEANRRIYDQATLGRMLANLPGGLTASGFSHYAAPLNPHREERKYEVPCPEIGFQELVRLALFLKLGKEHSDIFLDEIRITLNLQTDARPTAQRTSWSFRGDADSGETPIYGLQTDADRRLWTFQDAPPEPGLIYKIADKHAISLAGQILRPF